VVNIELNQNLFLGKIEIISNKKKKRDSEIGVLDMTHLNGIHRDKTFQADQL